MAVWVRDKELTKMLGRWIAEVPGGSKGHRNRHLKDYGKYLIKNIGTRFRKGGVNEEDNTGVWPELAPKTKKKRGSRPMLIKTGKLARSIGTKVAERGRRILQITPGVKYYWYHHYGFETTRTSSGGKVYKVKVPQRRLLLFTRANLYALDKYLVKWFKARA